MMFGPAVGMLPGSAASPTGIRPRDPPTAVTGLVFTIGLTAMVLFAFFGTVGAAVFLALWLLLAVAYGRASLSCLRCGPRLIWLMPCLAVLSILWSQSPMETLRYSLEYGATITFGVLSAWLLKPRPLLVALICSLIVLSVLSLAVGHEAADPFTGETALIGVFGSKNQLGFFASLMFLTALALFVDAGQPGPVRVLGCAAGLLSVPLMIETRSATSMTSVVLATMVLIFGLLASRLDRFGRSRVLLAALVMLFLGLAMLLAAGTDANGAFLRIVGKDGTLSGRTYLWGYAAQLIPDRPLLGVGFQAFWLHDDINAESIWSTFHIPGRTGFTFHNAFVEQTVQLGYVGTALLLVTLIGMTVGVVRWSWHVRSIPAAFFVALMACMLARSMTEVDYLGPFQLGAFVMAITATYAATKPREL